MKIIIHPELEQFIPPLKSEEFLALEQSILSDGIRDALVLWNNILIDGHHRHRLAQKHNIPFKTVHMDFADIDEVKIWMHKNQGARRNHTPYEKALMALKVEDIYARKAKQNQGKRTDILQKSVKSVNTQQELSKQAGVSHDTIHKVKTIERLASDKQKQELKGGRITINRLYTCVKHYEDKAKLQKSIQSKSKNIKIDDKRCQLYTGDIREVMKTIPDNSIDLLLSDPPYLPKDCENFELWSVLAREAERVLKPGGFLIAYAWTHYLPEYIKRLEEHLTYYWTIALSFKNKRMQLFPRKVITVWKPILIYQKTKDGKVSKPHRFFIDMIESRGKENTEKNYHHWQQETEELTGMINCFSKENDVIFDPFMGSGTTIIQSLKMNRRAIGIDIDPKCMATVKYRLKKELD